MSKLMPQHLKSFEINLFYILQNNIKMAFMKYVVNVTYSQKIIV